MKNNKLLALLILFGLFYSGVSFSQSTSGVNELSTAGSINFIKEEDAKEFTSLVNIPIRIGFYVSRQISLEPELIFTKIEREDPGYVASLNLLVNSNVPEPKIKPLPFFLIGGGIANALSLFNSFTLGKDWQDVTYKIINVGGGLRVMFSKSTAMRIEYRFQKFMGGEKEVASGDWRYTDKLGATYHNFYWGFSVFF